MTIDEEGVEGTDPSNSTAGSRSRCAALVTAAHPNQPCHVAPGQGSGPPDQGPGLVDQLLAPLGRSTVAVRVPYLYALPELLASSVLIATLPIPVAAILCARWPLKALPLPVSNPRLPVLLCWHERTAADPAAQFFRERVREASAEAAASLPH